MKLEADEFRSSQGSRPQDEVVRVNDLTQPVRMGNWWAPPLVDLEKYEAIMISGMRGSGKSTKGEKILEAFHKHGRVCISLTEAPFSYESMYMAIPRTGQEPIPVIYITPKDCGIDYPSDLDIAVMDEETPIKKVLNVAKNEKRMIIFCHSLWGPDGEQRAYKRLAKWITEMCLVQRTLRMDMAVLIREIEIQTYARLKSGRSSKDLKSALIDLVRLARSSYRISVIADLQLAGDMDRAMRGQLDKWLICCQDPEDMPKSMTWIHKKVESNRSLLRGVPRIRDRLFPSLTYLYPSEAYYVIRRKRKFSKLEFEMPSHRHKREKDDLTDFGIFVGKTGYMPVKHPGLEQFRRKYIGLEVKHMSDAQKADLAHDARELYKEEGLSWWRIGRAIDMNHTTIWKWATKRYPGEGETDQFEGRTGGAQ